jgi:epoxyqueuosine reductase QueG
MKAHEILLWGAADLRDFPTPRDGFGQRFPFALSFAVPVNRSIMFEVQHGPNHAYAEEYSRLNHRIDETSEVLAAEIRSLGFQALPLASSQRTDTVNIRGDFPHKTAATRAGLGWIGKHCQLITREYGSWVRLGTVFTDMSLPCGPALERSFCGRCTRCVDACPARALKGNAWHAGLPRGELLDVHACDAWKKERYPTILDGHVCGICSAVCPHALKQLRSTAH